MKAQGIRVLDVVLIGPAIIAGAALLPEKHTVLRSTLLVVGVGTIIYNGLNFLIIANDEAEV